MNELKKSIIAAVAVIAIMAPVAAGALSVADIQAQIQALVSRITTLQAQPASPASTIAGPIAKHRVCAALYRNLSHGSRGDDVMSLQEFLRAEGYLSANATGYFGPATRGALARWQTSQGVSAVGSLGPLSRARIAAWCGGGGVDIPPNQQRFSATPTRGEAPLSVTFETWLSGFRPQSIYYTIDFGDGTSERAADCPAPADACVGPGYNKHTYTSRGQYVATLNKITDPCPYTTDPTQPRCMAAIHSEVVATQSIVVGPQACTKEYKPVCGAKPIVCITAPCNPIPTTYGNRCEMNADGASFLYEGQCRSDWKNPADDPRCSAWYDGCNTCSRQTPGAPAMCTLRACFQQEPAYCTAYFDSAANKPPAISSFSGPTTLNVNETATWSVQASDPEGGSLSYSINWGDAYLAAPAYTAAEAFVQTTTFTHAYFYAGAYTITITVRDSSGQEARTTSTVRVHSTYPVACTADAYQCPNGQWVGRTGPNCQFVCN